jgi:putative phosphoribosyl transferase
MIFKNREEAGRKLAEQMQAYAGREDVIVLGIPRGGMEIAFPIAQVLGVPMDIFLSKKLGVPGQEELAFGAVAADGSRYLNERIVRVAGLEEGEMERITASTLRTLREREGRFRAGREPLDVTGKTVILVDDGIATGASMQAAVRMLKKMSPARLVVAFPVAPVGICPRLRREVDEVICLDEERDFFAVGQFYRDFSQVSDAEVIELMQKAEQMPAAGAGTPVLVDEANDPPGSGGEEMDVTIRVNGLQLEGVLHLPQNCVGVVLFAHGSGSSRFSPRNRFVAKVLQQRQIGTLLFDLLTGEEERVDERTAQLRFDIPMLAERMVGATRWLEEHLGERKLPFGLFGSSTGAAAALVAAAKLPASVGAVVSRGGRPDLAADALGQVEAPTLLLVGGLDHVVIGLNEEALAQLRCEKKLQIVPGATHLFEEPGTLEQVADLAAAWFIRHLGGRSGAERGLERAG